MAATARLAGAVPLAEARVGGLEPGTGIGGLAIEHAVRVLARSFVHKLGYSNIKTRNVGSFPVIQEEVEPSSNEND